MADEKILNNEIISDDELDEVAGGSYDESFYQMDRLNRELRVGFFPDDADRSVRKLGELYRRAGMKLEGHNGDNHPNLYYSCDAYGNITGRLTQAQAFDKLYFEIQHGLNTNFYVK